MPSPAKFMVIVEEAEGECFYRYAKGDIFEFIGLKTPGGGFCGAAYHTLFPVLFALNFGATYPEGQMTSPLISCPDGGKISFRVRKILQS